jgi:hypothetical protein
MSDIILFLQKENIETVWDVISDEEIFKFLSRDIQSKISNLFLNNIQGFFNTEKQKTKNLIDMNKNYILLMLNYIKKTYPREMPNKIKILEEPVKELITYEEIHNEKKTQFEKDFNKRQEEFTNSMKLSVPQVPDFADKYNDEPISEMDLIIKEMVSKRNYEVEQINKHYQNNIENVDNWLKPQETSIKNEKFNVVEKNNTQEKKQQKTVTWDKIESNESINLKFENIEEENINEENIFKKLKKIENINETKNKNLEKKNYTLEERIANIEKILNIYNK